MKRVQQKKNQDTVSSTCKSLRPFYSDMNKFLEIKDRELNTDELGVYINSLLASDLQNTGSPEQQAAAQQRINENMSSLRMKEQGVSVWQQCLQDEILHKQKYADQIYNLQKEVQEKQDAVNSMEGVAKEAEERAKLLEEPYTKTTKWEGWFPLGRPLQQTSLPVLLSFALLFLVLSLGMFLRLAQISLRLEFFTNSGTGYSRYGIGR